MKEKMSRCFLEPIAKDFKCDKNNVHSEVLEDLSRYIIHQNDLNIRTLIDAVIEAHNTTCIEDYRISYNSCLNAYDVHFKGEFLATIGVDDKIKELKGDFETTLTIEYFVQSNEYILGRIKKENLIWKKVKV